MKKTLLACLAVGAAAFSSFDASAVTAADLLSANKGDGTGAVYAMEVIYTPCLYSGGSYYAFPYVSSGNLRICPIASNANAVTVEGFWNGNIKMQFYVRNNQLVATNTYYKQYCLGTKPVTGDAGDFGSSKVFQLQEAYWTGWTYADTRSPWTGTISEEEDRYIVTFNPCVLYMANNTSMSGATSTSYEGLQLVIPKYTYNATVTDNYKNRDREYPAYVDVDWNDNTVYFINFTCRGFGIQNYAIGNGIYGDINSIYGNLLPNNRIEIPNQQQLTDISGSNVYKYNLCPATATKLGASIYGTYTVEPLDHVGVSRWHENSGGELVTMAKMNISLDNYKIRNDNLGSNVGPWNNTNMEAEIEYTANPTFANNVFGYGDTKVAVYAEIAEDKADNVDHYEVILIPGSKPNINADAYFKHTDHGHDKGFNMTLDGTDVSYITNPQPASRATAGNAAIEKEATLEQLKANGWSDTEIADAKKGVATMYIKTVYNNGLEPSYHALEAPRVTTGVDDIHAAASAATVVAGEGVIKVSGAEGTVEVYNAAGVQVYAGTDNEIAVAAGLYIVKAGNQATKVVVR